MIPVFDGHNDFLLRLLRDPGNRETIWLAGEGKGHLDLPRMKAGGFAGGFFAVYSYVALTTGERAIVSVINTSKLHQPIVTITHDPSGEAYIVPLVIDLANQDAEAPVRGIRSVLGTIPEEFERAYH